ncbi:hypothetical protein J4573_27580 [Actinomadura barringtoniae]|uniref:Ppx/GppA phosphatase N-terminal domain-containing protein n=1 Tax=Actinomadura barringtoniae TaxID=1427535 RepID=A0A939PLR7_9ACTN|nr:hypothetical protein [Actinomadura barringtoniae]MBO2450886.1 hypothetical protein [Actinomadura barringtoniae]
MADLTPGRPPEPYQVVNVPARPAEATDRQGLIGAAAVARLIKAVREAVAATAENGAEELIAFATAAVRDAANGPEVIAEVWAATGVALDFMDGEKEAHLTFCVARSQYRERQARPAEPDRPGSAPSLLPA